jgi:hypothetical protein
LSSSLAYDLIVNLNLTHRNLIDIWPSQQHLPIIDDRFRVFDDYENDKSEEEVKQISSKTFFFLLLLIRIG